MPDPILHKYIDFGASAVAYVTLTSRERISIVVSPEGSHFTFSVRGACFRVAGFSLPREARLRG
jgi:hypothetical protein